MSAPRLYHVVSVDEHSGRQTNMTAYPATHGEACTMVRKITAHPWRRLILVEWARGGK